MRLGGFRRRLDLRVAGVGARHARILARGAVEHLEDDAHPG
jgi:hypothetical protein